MIFVSFLVPIITCLVLAIFAHKKVVWWEYLVVFLPCVLGTAGIYGVFYYNNTSSIHYSSLPVVGMKYYEPWDEWIHKTCTRTTTDSKGKSKTVSYDCSYRKQHAEYWTLLRDTGTEHRITKGLWQEYLGLWGNPKGEFIDMHRRYYRKDGDAYKWLWPGSPETYLGYTRKESYRNYFKGSRNLYGLEQIRPKTADTLRLIHYPKITDSGQIDYILSNDFMIPAEAQRALCHFNSQRPDLNVFLLIYDSDETGSDIWLKQRSWWESGNDNELVVCLGYSRSKGILEWTRTFSWSLEPWMEKKIQTEIPRELVYTEILELLTQAYESGSWVPRDFTEYSYIRPEFKGYQVWIVFILTLLLSMGLSWCVVFNEFENN